MKPFDKFAECHERWRRAASYPDIRVALEKWSNARITLPCKTCKGTGLETWTGPHAGSCSRCRGAKVVDVTIEELRRAYRKLRKKVCEERGFERETFDAMVKKRVGDAKRPSAWYEAAMVLAKSFGIER